MSQHTERPSFDGSSIWQLTSLLTLNHYSLVAGDTGIQQIREMLSLFSPGNLRDFEQIRGIKKLVAKESVRRLQKLRGELSVQACP